MTHPNARRYAPSPPFFSLSHLSPTRENATRTQEDATTATGPYSAGTPPSPPFVSISHLSPTRENATRRERGKTRVDDHGAIQPRAVTTTRPYRPRALHDDGPPPLGLDDERRGHSAPRQRGHTVIVPRRRHDDTAPAPQQRRGPHRAPAPMTIRPHTPRFDATATRPYSPAQPTTRPYRPHALRRRPTAPGPRRRTTRPQRPPGGVATLSPRPDDDTMTLHLLLNNDTAHTAPPR